MTAAEQVERVSLAIAMEIWEEWPEGDGPREICRNSAQAAVAAMTPKTQALRRALGALHVVEEDHYGRYCKSCSTNDRRVTDPCPTHRVLSEFEKGNLPEIPDSSTLNVIAEVRAWCESAKVNNDDLYPHEILALLDREATQ